MKILFISNLNSNFENTNTYRLRAIKDLGHEAIFFEDRNFMLPGRIRQRFPFLHEWDLRRLNRQMIAVATKEQPDMCLAVGGYRILPATLKRFQEGGMKTILWTTDAPRPEFSNIVETAALYDHVLCAGTEAVDILTASGRPDAIWLPFACDPVYHRPLEVTREDESRYGKDIVFVGAYYPNRWEILRELVGNYDIAIWGPGWQVVVNNHNREHIHPHAVSYAQWVKMYNAAKIVMVIHYQDGVTPCCQASPKIFEALACRSFVMVDSQKDVQKLFSSGRHLVSFADIDDLKGKIDRYLSNDQERLRIAAAGYAEVLKRHTYRHRLQTIIELKGLKQ